MPEQELKPLPFFAELVGQRINEKKEYLNANRAAFLKNRRRFYFVTFLQSILGGGLFSVGTFALLATFVTLPIWALALISFVVGSGALTAGLTTSGILDFVTTGVDVTDQAQDKEQEQKKKKRLGILNSLLYAAVTAIPLMGAAVGNSANAFSPLVSLTDVLSKTVLGVAGATVIVTGITLGIGLVLTVIVAGLQIYLEKKAEQYQDEMKEYKKVQKANDQLEILKNLAALDPKYGQEDYIKAAEKRMLFKNVLFSEYYNETTRKNKVIKKFNYAKEEFEASLMAGLTEEEKAKREAEKEQAERLVSQRGSLAASGIISIIAGITIAIGVIALTSTIVVGLGFTGIGLVVALPIVFGIVAGAASAGLLQVGFNDTLLRTGRDLSAKVARRYGLDHDRYPTSTESEKPSLFKRLITNPAVITALFSVLVLVSAPIIGPIPAIVLAVVVGAAVFGASYYIKHRNQKLAQLAESGKEAKHKFLEKKLKELKEKREPKQSVSPQATQALVGEPKVQQAQTVPQPKPLDVAVTPEPTAKNEVPPLPSAQTPAVGVVESDKQKENLRFLAELPEGSKYYSAPLASRAKQLLEAMGKEQPTPVVVTTSGAETRPAVQVQTPMAADENKTVAMPTYQELQTDFLAYVKFKDLTYPKFKDAVAELQTYIDHKAYPRKINTEGCKRLVNCLLQEVIQAQQDSPQQTSTLTGKLTKYSGILKASMWQDVSSREQDVSSREQEVPSREIVDCLDPKCTAEEISRLVNEVIKYEYFSGIFGYTSPHDAKTFLMDLANFVGAKIVALEQQKTSAAREEIAKWQKVIERLITEPLSAINYLQLLKYSIGSYSDLAEVVKKDKYGIFAGFLLQDQDLIQRLLATEESGHGELTKKITTIRTALYENLDKAVEIGSSFAIKNLNQAFQQCFPNPDQGLPDKRTFFRSLPTIFVRGYDKIKLFSPLQERLIGQALPKFANKLFCADSSKCLLLGSRPLLKVVSGDEKAQLDALQKRTAPVQLYVDGKSPEDRRLSALEEVNEILKVRGVSTFNVTLWDIIYRGLQEKLKKNGEQAVDKLTITIQSLQEISEIFDENGQPRRIAGLSFLTNQKEIDAYVQQISPYLCKLGLITSKGVEVKLQRLPLYDHNVTDPKTGEVIEFNEYKRQIDDFIRAYENSDLTYVHCYSGKQRSPQAVGFLGMHENIEVCKELMDKVLEQDSNKLDAQITLNSFFQTPYEIFANIHNQREPAKSLTAMKFLQQQIIYEFWFTSIENLSDERYKNALAIAFASKRIEIVAKNLHLYLRGFYQKRDLLKVQGREQEFEQAEQNFHNFMFRVLRESKLTITELMAHYTKYAKKTDALKAFEHSFVPSMFLKFVKENPKKLLDKKPEEIAVYLKYFLLSKDVSSADREDAKVVAFLRALVGSGNKYEEVKKKLGHDARVLLIAMENSFKLLVLESTVFIASKVGGKNPDEELLDFMWNNKVALAFVCDCACCKNEQERGKLLSGLSDSILSVMKEITLLLSMFKSEEFKNLLINDHPECSSEGEHYEAFKKDLLAWSGERSQMKNLVTVLITRDEAQKTRIPITQLEAELGKQRSETTKEREKQVEQVTALLEESSVLSGAPQSVSSVNGMAVR